AHRTDCRRTASAGRGTGRDGPYRGALVGGGGASAQRRTPAGAGGHTAKVREGRRMFSARPGGSPPSAGQVSGAAGRDEYEPAVAAPGQVRCSIPPASGDIRLVYRRI